MENKRRIKTAELISTTSPYIQELLDRSEYVFEIIPKISEHIKTLLLRGIKGFTELSAGVLVGEDVKIAESAVIEPPAIIGKGSVLRPGAYLRGNVIIGEGCVIGNSTEIKNSLISDRAQMPHYNYVGDSVLGLHAHLGAGAICSNLRLDGATVTLTLDKKYDTHLRKFGAALGDKTDIGCNCVLNPGTVIGRGTAVYPLLSLGDVYPENSIIKARDVSVAKEEK